MTERVQTVNSPHEVNLGGVLQRRRLSCFLGLDCAAMIVAFAA